MSWEKVKLGEVAKVSSSKRIFAYQYVDKGIPFYSLNCQVKCNSTE